MNYISMFIFLKTDYFQSWFLYKSDNFVFLLQEPILELYKLDTFKPRIYYSFRIFDPIYVTRVQLWIVNGKSMREMSLKNTFTVTTM